MPSEEQTYREGIKTSLKEILEQTKKTNGRVNKLELRMTVALTAIIVIIALKMPEALALFKIIL